ncbi:MAG: acyltransferase [Polyangiaceae bacterium]
MPALDALRGVAVLAVFAQHLGDTHMPFVRARVNEALPAAIAPWILTVLHHAHWGVDLFFVLSGFSLAQPLLGRAARSGAEGLAFSAWGRSFFRRRAARIYPGYLAALALVIVAAPAVRNHPSFPASLVAHVAMLQGYFVPGGLAIIGAAWSLSTEVAFYLAWPLLAPRVLSPPSEDAHPQPPSGRLPLPNRSLRFTPLAKGGGPSSRIEALRPWLIGASIVIAAWLLRGTLHEVALGDAAHPWLLEATQRRWAVCRIDQFVLGALAASAHARIVRSSVADRVARIAPLLTLIAAVALVPAFYLEGSFFLSPLGSWPYALVSIATAALVLSSALVSQSASKWLFPAPLRWVGVVSYGVFLNHQLALGATAHLAGPPGSWRALSVHAALGVALSLVIGWISWVVVERPMIERSR